jgi:hypothetical protein
MVLINRMAQSEEGFQGLDSLTLSTMCVPMVTRPVPLVHHN